MTLLKRSQDPLDLLTQLMADANAQLQRLRQLNKWANLRKSSDSDNIDTLHTLFRQPEYIQSCTC